MTLGFSWKTASLSCCCFAIFCSANDQTQFTTVASPQESQLVASKENKNPDGGWTWSQPDTLSSIISETQTPPPNFVSSHYLSGQGFNRNGAVALRSEYFPYPYEVGPPVEDAHPVFPTQNTENALASIKKHFAIVSFIGLLLLFAIVQNTISASREKEALSLREKRDVVAIHGTDPMLPEIEDVLSEDTKIRCMQRTLCLENKKLGQHLGRTGKLLAKYLTRTVEISLEASSGWYRLLEDASQAGLRGEDCRILYRDCSPAEDSRPELD
ncbi:uncharacterized protein LOC124310286 [Neodiprion virginianus]|uniref:uncharacterized protein LOC124310286 n=1 Tax=Neodiprion virginianus TaxID=2961670 RepID=UPI001EE708AB|nr:uncharacterized protein LOC124310286 [Neodiprion virginianus]